MSGGLRRSSGASLVDGAMSIDWDAGRPVDLRSTLMPLVRGRGDPSHRFVDGRFWWAAATPAGAATIVVAARGSTVSASAWGGGAPWLLDRVPALLGSHDDWTGVDVAAHPALARVLRARPGLRLCATGLVMESLVPAVLEQKVTGMEARRAWRTMLHRCGTPAPGPTPGPMRVVPSPVVLRDLPTWEWHRMGVDSKRRSTIRAAASVAHRLEESTAANVLTRLRAVPGVGEWTAAETAQRAFGHPDAVSVGDYHLKNWVVHALTGRPRGSDEQMLQLLAPWAGQRQRVVRLIELTGAAPPRFGPRFAPNDIRAI
ncbi:MAG: DNA-3-methyladenine glycosylase family protein [Jatrophihabitantaceae bacterium]